ncbi:hypothetical protein DFP72DRAFT_1065988 [Ephemerocybe angulata]|uniref:C2H2-type domain-containing protein n=1 Tax=Ephemerocybe angulata TaxID=980116 RepID=A0A8H6MAK5_9AGAR|nr:hypothetical protein DFP72DRAFT_1065988 [Tulosesus angulatus]
MSIQDDLNITVVGPDDAPTMPMNIPVGMYRNGVDPSFEFFPSTPDQEFSYGPASLHGDGDSSGGYSTPITPFLDLNTLPGHQKPSEGYDQLVTPVGQFSPSSLSPSFGGLTLSDAYSDNSIFADNSTDLTFTKDPSFGYSMQEPSVFNQSRASLQVTIPHQDQQQQLADPFEFLHADMFSADSDFTSPEQSAFTPMFDPYNLNEALPLPVENTTLQRSTRVNHHQRGLSVAGTSWTASAASTSSTLTSPSLSFTPSDYQNSGHLSPPSPYLNTNVDLSILTGEATVHRRHSSHTGNSRSTSRGDRGRSHSRSGGAPPSASSSRRSSPYPSPRTSCSPSDTLSPQQVWEPNDNLLTVPHGGGASISRRHSIGARPPHADDLMFGMDSLTPSSWADESSTSLPGAPLRKVASTAGIKASEARRTKEAKFACTLCTQTFTTNHNLKNHQNVHNGIKEHSCPSCNRQFTTQSVMTRHLKTCKLAHANS